MTSRTRVEPVESLVRNAPMAMISAEYLEALTLPPALLAGRRVFVASDRQPPIHARGDRRHSRQRSTLQRCNPARRQPTGAAARRRGLTDRRLGNRHLPHSSRHPASSSPSEPARHLVRRQQQVDQCTPAGDVNFNGPVARHVRGLGLARRARWRLLLYDRLHSLAARDSLSTAWIRSFATCWSSGSDPT